MSWKKWLIVVAAVLLIAAWLWPVSPVTHAPGVLVAGGPVRTKIDAGKPWKSGPYELTPLMEFSVEARLLSKERYRWDRESQVAPYDLALGWGPMSDSAVLATMEISQGNRWFYWSWEKQRPAIGDTDIIANASNMHIIPSNDAILSALKSLRVGQIVKLRGKLVEVKTDDGWRWRSSLSNTDSGRGACELVWLEAIDARDER